VAPAAAAQSTLPPDTCYETAMPYRREPMTSREPWGLYVATIKTLNKPKNGK